MSQKFHSVSTSWEYGEISEDYAAAQTGEEVFRGAAREITNAFPMRSGGLTRRPSTQIIVDRASPRTLWQDLDPDNSYFAPFRRNDGSLAIIRAHVDGTDVDFSWINTTTGVSTAIDTIAGTSNVTLSRPVQAGPSQFWTLGSEAVCRIVETTANAFELRVGDPSLGAGSDGYYFQMQGLWSYDKIVDENVIHSEPNTGTAAYDEFEELGRVILVGANAVAAAATPRTVRDGEPEDPDDILSTNNEFISITQIAIGLDDPDDIVSFADSSLAAVLGPVTGSTDYFPHAKQVEFFQGRLVIADFSDGPRSWVRPKQSDVQIEDKVTINFSQTGSPFIIKPGSVADNAPIEVTLFTRSGQTLNWLLATDQRIFLGLDNEIVTFAGAPLTPTTIHSKQTLNIGTEPSVYPIQDNTRLVFLSKGKGGIFGAQFQDLTQGFQGLELSRYAYHLVGDITELHLTPVVQGDPAKRLWCLKADGTVACMAVLNDLDPRIPPAWSTFSLAEEYLVKAIVSDADELYAIVEDPDSSTKHEIIKVVFEDTPDFVFDFKETDTGVADTTVWTVINTELENQDVFAAVYDDGELVHTGVYTVLSGVITTSVGGTECQFGLVFNSKIRQFDTQITDSLGPTQFRKHKITKANIYVKDTRQLLVNNRPLLPSTPPTPSSTVRKVTGTEDILTLGWDTEHELEFASSAAYNFTILGLSREVEI